MCLRGVALSQRNGIMLIYLLSISETHTNTRNKMHDHVTGPHLPQESKEDVSGTDSPFKKKNVFIIIFDCLIVELLN